jgi:DNA polymerase elongation subunit (family B)
MSLRVFVDIESLPPDKEDLTRFPKVSEACESDEERYRRLALDGDYGRILTIGVIVERDGQVDIQGCFGRDRDTADFHLDEARTLKGFWKLLVDFDVRRDVIIGHNIFNFDLPFIYKRSVIHRVQVPVVLSFARYRSQPVYDTMHEWNRWDLKKYTALDDLARILGLESSKTDHINGAHVYDRFCEGGHTAIADYCMRDVKLTRDIYYRLTQQEKSEP